MRLPLAGVGLALVALLAWSAQVATQSTHRAVHRSEFIYDRGPYPSVHASTIEETTSGQLLAAWFGGTEEGHPDVSIWVSRYVDGMWSSGVKVADGVQDPTTRHPTL
jgi:predicted neuraminidase